MGYKVRENQVNLLLKASLIINTPRFYDEIYTIFILEAPDKEKNTFANTNFSIMFLKFNDIFEKMKGLLADDQYFQQGYLS